MKFPAVIAFALSLAIAAPVTASVADGVEKWKNGDYKEAVILWLPAAARGDAHALFNLGLAHRQGRGVPKDLDRAEDFFRRAAQKGHNPARTYLGIFLARRGEDAEAVRLWTLAARAGDPHARYMLAIRMFNGDSVQKDWPRAYAYMLMARNAGLPQATKALAKMNANMPPADREKGKALAEQMLTGGNADKPMVTGTPRAADPDASPAARAAAVARAEGTLPSPADRAAPAERPIPTRVAAVPPAIAPQDVTSYRVQLAAYGREDTARSGWATIRAAHPDVLSTVEPVFQPFDGGVRLQIGNYPNRASAAELCGKLEAQNRACFVTAVAAGGN